MLLLSLLLAAQVASHDVLFWRVNLYAAPPNDKGAAYSFLLRRREMRCGLERPIDFIPQRMFVPDPSSDGFFCMADVTVSLAPVADGIYGVTITELNAAGEDVSPESARAEYHKGESQPRPRSLPAPLVKRPAPKEVIVQH